MLYLLGGVAILGGLLLLGYLFLNADPRRLAVIVKWSAIVFAALAVVALVVSGRLALLLGLAAAALPALRRAYTMTSGWRGPQPGSSSEAETPFIRMSLDHDTGTMRGTVLQGRFAGMRLDELGRADLVALLRECRGADEQGARLVEAYLDRTDSAWRDDLYGEQPRKPTGGGADVTLEEAYAILGLAPGADAETIKAAHHRLMKQLHPDHGGTDYLAAKINRARDVLLSR
jgi:DnaJ-domain-containing protein 1